MRFIIKAGKEVSASSTQKLLTGCSSTMNFNRNKQLTAWIKLESKDKLTDGILVSSASSSPTSKSSVSESSTMNSARESSRTASTHSGDDASKNGSYEENLSRAVRKRSLTTSPTWLKNRVETRTM